MKKKKEPRPYASRGGLKLEHALNEFKINPERKIALDVGASTGGFTDCLLKRGASLVYAIDVGYGLLDWKLRNDPRVIVMERTNIRYLSPDKLKQGRPELGVIDVSFISLTKVLPVVYDLLAAKSEAVALIKPQFEARRQEVGRGGIVRDEKVHQGVVEKIKGAAKEMGFQVRGITKSPITGADGNVEFFIHLAKE